MLVVYIASLVLLVVASLFLLDQVIAEADDRAHDRQPARRRSPTADFVQVVVRSVGVAVAVTVLCLVIALPDARSASPRSLPRWMRRGLVVAVLLPLWAGYLVKAYAWKAMLRRRRPSSASTSDGGFFEATFGWTPGFGMAGGHPVAQLPVAAVHGAADLHRARAAAGVVARRRR